MPSCAPSASRLSPVFPLRTPEPFIACEQALQLHRGWCTVSSATAGRPSLPPETATTGDHRTWVRESQTWGWDITPSCPATSFWLGVITWYLDRHNIKCFLCIWKYQDLNQPEEFPTPSVCQTHLPMASLFLKVGTGWICVWSPHGAGHVRDWRCDGLTLWYLKAIFTT